MRVVAGTSVEAERKSGKVNGAVHLKLSVTDFDFGASELLKVRRFLFDFHRTVKDASDLHLAIRIASKMASG